MDYTAFNEGYMSGQFRFFQGGTGSPKNVQAPKDAVTSVIGGGVRDSEVYSYMGTDGTPRALVCNVTTVTPGQTSTGRYFVCKPDLSGADVAWTLVSGGTDGFMLGVEDDPGPPPLYHQVVGNPSGVAQVGNYLYITDYDTTSVYIVATADLETAASGGYAPVTELPITSGLPEKPSGESGDIKIHGVSLIALTDKSVSPAVTKLFALYNGVFEDGTHTYNPYVAATVIRLSVDSSTGAVTQDLNASVAVGKNTQSLTPVYDGTGAIDLLIPAIGGYQNAGTTNGSDSTLHLVSGIFGAAGAAGTLAASIVFTGDGTPPSNTGSTTGPAISTLGNYDIKSVGASDSAIVWVLLVTNDSNYLSWWRLFKTTVTKILGSTGKTLTTAITDGTLTPVDSGFGSPGYYWELLCESSITDPGRLWFVMGTPVRISAMDNYDDKVLFDEGTLYAKVPNQPFPESVNIDSADLIGEMIYQYSLGNSIDTRLIKGQKPAQDEDDD
jgi:hypothetical protein